MKSGDVDFSTGHFSAYGQRVILQNHNSIYLMENLDLDLEELYTAIKDKAEAEGAFSREEWDNLVDELLEEKRGAGEMSDDDDIMEISEALKARFEEAEEEVEEF